MASMIDGTTFNLSEEEIAEYEAEGYEYEKYVDIENGYTGYILSQKGAKLNLTSVENTEEKFTAKTILDGNYLTVDGRHVTINLVPFDDDDNLSYLSLIKSYNGFAKINFELPVKPTTHNATVVSKDGKTLTWDLTRMEAKESIHVEYDMPISIWVWLIPVICVALVAIVVVIFFIVKKKKNASSEPITIQNDLSEVSIDSTREHNQVEVDSLEQQPSNVSQENELVEDNPSITQANDDSQDNKSEQE